MKVALAAERSQAARFENIANFWQEWVNEEVEEGSRALRRGQIKSQKQPIISKPTTLYEKHDSETKFNSMDNASDPDLDLLLDDPPLRSVKSESTEADSKDLELIDHQQLHHGKQGFKGGKNTKRCCGEMPVVEPMPAGEVVINAELAGATATAATAEMF